ncbi:YbaB/EbfC family nucleoid-associated protein [Tamaricihabitans halophyticus]|uniref:YbaB/EbfC family nucleoid-associated protein n=1 Tax=Tamaricihabitans halophyticus TaxID=1262583 RepID=UPI0014052E31|nr:YbaB/EbfC family nucleoid-associated protein [Tamaricihabitans halophyticus]
MSDSQRLAEQYGQVHQRMADTTVTERTPDGSLAVTVSTSGAVTDIRISEQATDGSAAELSAGVLRLIKQAQAKIADRTRCKRPNGRYLADSRVSRCCTSYPRGHPASLWITVAHRLWITLCTTCGPVNANRPYV